MTTRTAQRLEVLSNVAVIIAAVVLVTILVRREWPSPQPGSAASLQGKTIDFAALNGTPAKRSLIMFISETCHFCEKEMPFYRTLRETLPSGTSLVAVFPQHESDPGNFLAARSVQVDHVSSSDALAHIGVMSTPTLLLVDQRGTVKRAWVGAQPEANHKEILASAERDF